MSDVLRDAALAVRFLALDAIAEARSGHPGMPLGMADIAAVLWTRYLKHCPGRPDWWNRDRFVLSNGHGSMLLYACLHLSGYDLSMDDLKAFRQWHSRTPGHPEWGVTPGVETTTGPLGQGLGHAVGMALAEKTLAAQFPEPGLVDHFTYAFVGDGCLMEGVSHEVCGLAGVHQLGKLIVFWDDNHMSIDGPTQGWFQDDTQKRFEAYGWQVLTVDGHDPDAIAHAIEAAQADSTRPSLLACRTTIGWGSPLAGTASVHGSPLDAQTIAEMREALGWSAPPFEVPASVYEAWRRPESAQAYADWETIWTKYQVQFPSQAVDFLRRQRGESTDAQSHAWEAWLNNWVDQPPAMASRQALQQSLGALASVYPEWLGGSADLSPSNGTAWPNKVALPDQPDGQYVHYGVREFGMFAVMTGVALHGGFLPFGGTFLTFVDYGRNAVRLAAMMKQRVVFVLTHDSVALGEDGPTHQPVEHLAHLRSMPGLEVWRPADAFETAVALKACFERSGPSALVLSRQTLPALGHSIDACLSLLAQGVAWVRQAGEPDGVMWATGSEVALAAEAAAQLAEQDQTWWVLSVSCLDRLMDSVDWREYWPEGCPLITVEAGLSLSWHRLARWGRVEHVSVESYGESAPGSQVLAAFGLTVEAVVQRALACLKD